MQEQCNSYSSSVVDEQNNLIYFEKLVSFAEKFIKSQRDLDYEERKYLEDNFWDLV